MVLISHIKSQILNISKKDSILIIVYQSLTLKNPPLKAIFNTKEIHKFLMEITFIKEDGV
jgi:hypothetical protein